MTLLNTTLLTVMSSAAVAPLNVTVPVVNVTSPKPKPSVPPLTVTSPPEVRVGLVRPLTSVKSSRAPAATFQSPESEVLLAPTFSVPEFTLITPLFVKRSTWAMMPAPRFTLTTPLAALENVGPRIDAPETISVPSLTTRRSHCRRSLPR